MICGPPDMQKTVPLALKNLGVSEEIIYFK